MYPDTAPETHPAPPPLIDVDHADACGGGGHTPRFIGSYLGTAGGGVESRGGGEGAEQPGVQSRL